MKGELEDMKAMVKLLLEEVRKRPKGGLEPAASSDVGADALQVTADKVAPASDPQATGKAAKSGHTGSTTAVEPLHDTNADIGSQPECGKKKQLRRRERAKRPRHWRIGRHGLPDAHWPNKQRLDSKPSAYHTWNEFVYVRKLHALDLSV